MTTPVMRTPHLVNKVCPARRAEETGATKQMGRTKGASRSGDGGIRRVGEEGCDAK